MLDLLIAIVFEYFIELLIRGLFGTLTVPIDGLQLFLHRFDRAPGSCDLIIG